MPWLTNTTLPQNLLYICRHAVHEPCSAWTRSACSFRSVWSSSRSEPLRQLGASLLWWMIHCKGNEWPLLRMGLLVFCPWALHFLEFWLDLDSTHLFFTSMETGIVYAWVYRKTHTSCSSSPCHLWLSPTDSIKLLWLRHCSDFICHVSFMFHPAAAVPSRQQKLSFEDPSPGMFDLYSIRGFQARPVIIHFLGWISMN